MVSNEVTMLPLFALSIMAREQDTKTWTKIQQDFQEYSTVMNRILDLYKFTTDAQPLPTTRLYVTDLNFNWMFYLL